MKNLNKSLLSIVATISLALGACSKTEQPINPAETIGVSVFLNDHALMEKTNKWCMESLGDRGELPNCMNAGVAAIKLRRCKEFKKTKCE